MIQEQYVSFEVAKLLRKKGFDESVHAWHNIWDGRNLDFRISEAPHLQIQAPTQQMAMRWLREVHNLHIFTVPRWEDVEYMPGLWQDEMVGYQYVILSIGNNNREINHPITTALTPESSYEAAIKYCLEKLI